MASSLNINDILAQVKQLDKEDQFTLLQRLASLLKKKEVTTTAAKRLTELSGLGSEIWKGTHEIDDYIERERQW
jgi:hypothetical protein